MDITIDGKSYKVAHLFDEKRCLVEYEGLYVFADKAFDGTWELSGEPARENEKPVLAAFLNPMLGKTIVTVTPPDDE